MPALHGETSRPGEAAVKGTSKSGPGIHGISQEFDGVHATTNSPQNAAIAAYNLNAEGTGATLFAENRGRGPGLFARTGVGAAVDAKSEGFEAVHAETNSPGTAVVAAYNLNSEGTGAILVGENRGRGPGLFVRTGAGAALDARSEAFEALHAETNAAEVAAIAAYNVNPAGTGASLFADNRGRGPGVFVRTGIGAAVDARSEAYEAVHAETNSPNTAAIAAYNLNADSTGAALYADHRGVGPAGFFKGNVIVTGDVLLTGADLAENFSLAETETDEVVPGTVVVIDGIDRVRMSTSAYDSKVAGVVSGAGDYRPGVILDHRDQRAGRYPLALVGKVYCRVDASYAPVGVGDLLTTSDTPGHAMKALDPGRSFGAVIGKAMSALDRGIGLIPILVLLR
ncbi:hypothetical protein ACIBKY_15385 [Nonomuraea sp. NPDC050394]|uniref:hypothetical protein n=1 Tax=Nonomuraea sp. NPDC050394 TaxID=3364363 RepID=UPI0037BB2984